MTIRVQNLHGEGDEGVEDRKYSQMVLLWFISVSSTKGAHQLPDVCVLGDTASTYMIDFISP